MIAYQGCRKRALGSGRGKGVADRRGGRGKWVEKGKKILNSGNEPKNVLRTKDLAFSEAQNELVFECKKGQSNPKKWPKNRLLYGIVLEFDAPAPVVIKYAKSRTEAPCQGRGT
jgi:hypothetical protein